MEFSGSSSGKRTRHISENGEKEKCPIDRLKKIYQNMKKDIPKVLKKDKLVKENIPHRTVYGFTKEVI